MFFDRFGQKASLDRLKLSPSSDAALPGVVSRNQKISQQNIRIRRHRAIALILAANFAVPLALLSHASPARAQGAPSDVRPAWPAISATADATPTTGPSADNAVLAAASPSAQDLFQTGVQQYQDGKYEEAAATLGQVAPGALSPDDQVTYGDTLSKAYAAAKQRKIARDEFNLGEQALQNKQYNDAIKHYQNALDNHFADAATQSKAKDQIALAQTNAQSTGVDSKSLYIQGRDAFRNGDFVTARKDLIAARDAGYKPGLFEESPSSILARLDAKEQSDAAAASAPAPASVAAPTPKPVVPPPAPAAVVPPTPAPAPVVQRPVTPAPVAPAPVPAAPAPEAAAPVAAAPEAPPAETSPADRALDEAANYQKIKKQQQAYEAEQLVERARREQAANQKIDALNDYTRAAELDPTNQQAMAGRDELASLTGVGPQPSGLPKVETEINERISAIRYQFGAAIDAANQAIAAGDFEKAQRAVDRATIARNTDPTIFTQPQVNNFDSIIATTAASLERARQAKEKSDADRALASSQRDQAARAQQAREDRERTVSGLIQDARQYIEQGKYREALAVIDHIQTLDPTNEYAGSVRLLIEDKAANQTQRQFREENDREYTRTLNAVEEEKIPYEDILKYPSNWPEISELRDREVSEERGENNEDTALQAKLDTLLPVVQFSANSFADVVDWLRDVTGANIYVDWAALERASISRDAPVTAKLRDIKVSKALELIFKNVEGATDAAKLGYTIDEGVITISTRTELDKNVVTERYDINDLLFVPPDYTDAPTLTLQSQSNSAGGGGSGGAAGGQGLFGGGGAGGGAENTNAQATREQRIDEIKKYISDNVDNTSWKDNGGDVGTISSSPLRAILLITQTPENHQKIIKVLDSLRSSQALQVSIETRFLTIQRNYLEDIGVNADFTFNPLSNPADPNSGVWSSKFSPIGVTQNAVTGAANPTFNNGTTGGGSASLDWASQVGNAEIPGSIASNPADYPNPIVISGSYIDNMTVNFLIRAVQANEKSTELTAPRLTLFSGQRAYIIVSTDQAYVSGLTPVVATGAALFQPTVSTVSAEGVVLSVQATVSPDQKYVFLDMQPQLSRLLALTPLTESGLVTIVGANGSAGATETITGTLELPTQFITVVKTSCSVPDGATLLLGGQTLAGETEREQGVPVLSKIPFLKRLFTNRASSQDEQVLLILVKPTILIQHEQEQKQFPLLSSKVGMQ